MGTAARGADRAVIGDRYRSTGAGGAAGAAAAGDVTRAAVAGLAAPALGENTVGAGAAGGDIDMIDHRDGTADPGVTAGRGIDIAVGVPALAAVAANADRRDAAQTVGDGFNIAIGGVNGEIDGRTGSAVSSLGGSIGNGGAAQKSRRVADLYPVAIPAVAPLGPCQNLMRRHPVDISGRHGRRSDFPLRAAGSSGCGGRGGGGRSRKIADHSEILGFGDGSIRVVGIGNRTGQSHQIHHPRTAVGAYGTDRPIPGRVRQNVPDIHDREDESVAICYHGIGHPIRSLQKAHDLDIVSCYRI